MEAAFKIDYEAEEMRKWYEWFNSSEPSAIQAREISEQHSSELRRKEIEERKLSKDFLNEYVAREGLVSLYEEFNKNRNNKIVRMLELAFIEAVENLKASTVIKNEVRDLLKQRFVSYD